MTSNFDVGHQNDLKMAITNQNMGILRAFLATKVIYQEQIVHMITLRFFMTI